MRIDEAAQALNVSPRRVRALIKNGQVTAHKLDGAWEITDLRRAGETSRRPLSESSRTALAHALHYRTLNGITGTLRARTAARLRLLRTSPSPASILIDWWGGEAQPGSANFADNLVDFALHGDAEYVTSALHRPRREYLRRASDLADVVHSERTICGVTPLELAERANVTADTVRELERGIPPQSPAATLRILRALGVDATALPDVEVV